MAQYVFTMNRVGKIVPPKRQILKDISLSFFPGAKIGVLGVNGSGKSTLLKIMAGLDKEFTGEARAADGVKMGYLEQEPHLDPALNVWDNVIAWCEEKKLFDRYNAALATPLEPEVMDIARQYLAPEGWSPGRHGGA